ncbi:MAG: ribosomal-protein-alanine N-acetyltransferase [Chloroflexi bacterium]|nr:ribosomal-protein-alanine N-acetyltransferase [Chloroflexota bacterium]
MQVRHIPAVSAIERESFPSAWPSSAYRREIQRNRMAYYIVAKRSSAARSQGQDTRFPITSEQHEDGGLFWHLKSLLRNDARPFSREEVGELETIVGYAGMWVMVDEAHVTTIAVDPTYRGEGIGELLLVALLDRSQELRAEQATLEVRVSNAVAQQLYWKYTFQNAGLRRRYYSDDGEDALIMTTKPLASAVFQEVFAHHRRKLLERLRTD